VVVIPVQVVLSVAGYLDQLLLERVLRAKVSSGLAPVSWTVESLGSGYLVDSPTDVQSVSRRKDANWSAPAQARIQAHRNGPSETRIGIHAVVTLRWRRTASLAFIKRVPKT
jgi:hypothetical protein